MVNTNLENNHNSDRDSNGDGGTSVEHRQQNATANDTDLENNVHNNDRDSNGDGGTSVEDRQQNSSISGLLSCLMVVNVAIFIVTMLVNNCPKNNDGSKGHCVVPKFLGRLSFQPFHDNPQLGPSDSTLIKMGALQRNKVVHEHQGWRLLTSMWLHFGVVHILCNMMSLKLMRLVDLEVGCKSDFRRAVKIGIIYLLSGFGGSVLSSIFLRNRVSVGASGAVFGLLGAMLSEIMFNWTSVEKPAEALLCNLIFSIFISWFFVGLGSLPHFDNFVLIGGFSTGFLLGIVLLIRPRLGGMEHDQLHQHAPVETEYMAPHQHIFVVFALALLIVGFVVSLVMLFRLKLT